MWRNLNTDMVKEESAKAFYNCGKSGCDCDTCYAKNNCIKLCNLRSALENMIDSKVSKTYERSNNFKGISDDFAGITWHIDRVGWNFKQICDENCGNCEHCKQYAICNEYDYLCETAKETLIKINNDFKKMPKC